MKLLRANFWSVCADSSRVLGEAPDSINVDRMIAREATDDDTNHGTLACVENQQSAHQACRIECGVAGGEQVLQANKISGGFAHALKRYSAKMLRRAAAMTLRILKVADLVGNGERELTLASLQDLHECSGYKHRLFCLVGIGVDFWSIDKSDGVLGQRVLLHSALDWVFGETRVCLRNKARELGLLSNRAERTEQHDSRETPHSFLSFAGAAALYSLAGEVSTA
jgi:hypothetical protein